MNFENQQRFTPRKTNFNKLQSSLQERFRRVTTNRQRWFGRRWRVKYIGQFAQGHISHDGNCEWWQVVSGAESTLNVLELRKTEIEGVETLDRGWEELADRYGADFVGDWTGQVHIIVIMS